MKGTKCLSTASQACLASTSRSQGTEYVLPTGAGSGGRDPPTSPLQIGTQHAAGREAIADHRRHIRIRGNRRPASGVAAGLINHRRWSGRRAGAENRVPSRLPRPLRPKISGGWPSTRLPPSGHVLAVGARRVRHAGRRPGHAARSHTSRRQRQRATARSVHTWDQGENDAPALR